MIFADRELSQKLERTEARSNVDFVKARVEMFPESGAEWMEAAGDDAERALLHSLIRHKRNQPAQRFINRFRIGKICLHVFVEKYRACFLHDG
jgi:hypothetical protein